MGSSYVVTGCGRPRPDTPRCDLRVELKDVGRNSRSLFFGGFRPASTRFSRKSRHTHDNGMGLDPMVGQSISTGL
eukprot:1876270-Prymnesium_polylepis.1